jgi:hydroxymethylpyrimidine/phosphomethylpyrimidine kinase
VVVGGLDPGGGAGLLRDVATARALGAQPHAVGTAWTEQGEGIHRVEPRAPATVGAALAHALGGVRPAGRAQGPESVRPAGRPLGLDSTPPAAVAAVKIGMAVGPATAAALIEALSGFAGPVVVDPVLATSRGGALWNGPPQELLPLLRRAALVTPNALEAAALSGRPVATVAEAEAAGRHLVEVEGLATVLVKGGHLADSDGSVTDVLVTPAGTTRYPHPRLPGPSPRGTGCSLATAIAVELGRGSPLAEAVQAAIDWLVAAIAAATSVGDERHLTHGGGP